MNKKSSKMWRKKLGRTLFYIIMALQLMSLVERQIFDFLGYMWLPMLLNFVNIIIAILGIFGNYQYHTTYLLIYLIWTFFWVGWNIFIVCFYLELGNLKLNMDVFSFSTGSYSYWLLNGHGCEIMDELPDAPQDTYLDNASSSVQLIALPKTKGCFLDYQYVEVLHASIQIIFAFFGILFGAILINYYYKEIDVKRNKAKKSSNMYSIEYSPQRNENGTIPNGNARGHTTDDDLYSSATLAGRPGTSISNMLEDGNDRGHGNMTPRRVKRRSYTRSSARSASKAELGKNKSSTNHRSSTRSYHGSGTRNKDRAAQNKSQHMNPVNRLIDDQQRLSQKNPTLLPLSSSQFQNDSSTSNDESRNAMIAAERMYGQINPGFQNSRPNSMVYSINQHDASATDSQQPDTEGAGVSRGAHGPNIGGAAPPDSGDYEINRPPSALTSYSNFHPHRRPPPTSQATEVIPMTNVQAQIQTGGNRLLQHDAPPSSLGIGINLTQESLTQQPISNLLQPNVNVDTNASFDDDLPPPPPPLSSSPTAELNHQLDAPSTTGAEEDTDSVNNSSIVTAQPTRGANLPVPLERTVAARRSRNEYVNIPQVVQQIQQQNFSRLMGQSNSGDNHGNTNHIGRSGNIKMPISSPESSMSIGGMHNGHSSNDTPPLPPHGSSAKNTNLYNGDSTQGEMPSYANTQTAESQLMPPPLPPHSRRSGQQNLNQFNDQHRNNGANVIETSRPNRFGRDSAGISGGLSLYSNENLLNANSNSTDQLQSYGDTQTLRADDSRLQFRGLAINPQFSNQKIDSQSSSQNKQSAEPMAPSTRPHRQITIDYDLQNSTSQQYLPQHHQQNQRALSSLGNSSSTDNTSSVPNSPAKVEPPKQQFVRAEQPVLPKPTSTNTVVEGVGIQHRRTNSGSSSRDNYRASLRAKHRRDMQEKVLRQQEQQQATSRNGPSNPSSQPSNRILGAIKKQPMSSQNRDEDDYGFTKSPEYGTRVPNHSMSPASNPIQNNHSGLPNGHTPNSHFNPSSQPMMNGNHQPRNAMNTNGTDHQWYMRDSMKPIDATQHGGNCKCYRCQRKLTAI